MYNDYALRQFKFTKENQDIQKEDITTQCYVKVLGTKNLT